jgi:histone-lysine N-methyltransferase SETMAR
MVSVFSHRDRILLVDHLEKGATITDSYYTSLLDKVKQAMVSKQQGKLSKGVLFLQDNASSRMAAITQQKLADLHFEVLTHPAHSSDLAASDYHLFPNFKNI